MRNTPRLTVALLVATMAVIGYNEPAVALQFDIDTVNACCVRDTLLMTNGSVDTIAVDSISYRTETPLTSSFLVEASLRLQPVAGPIWRIVSIRCFGDSVGDSLRLQYESGGSFHIPPAHLVWVEFPWLNIPPPPTAKFQAAAGTDTMAVMVTFHSPSGNDSVLFLNTQAEDVPVSRVEHSARASRHTSPSRKGREGTFTIRGERVSTVVPARGVAVVPGQLGANARVVVGGAR